MTKKTTNDKKKVEKQIKNMNKDENSKLKVLAIVCGVICILCLFYLLSVYIINKDSSSSNSSTDTSIQYSEILSGETFNRNESEYLVVLYDESGSDVSTISSAITTYDNTEGALALYTVDLSSALNKSVITDGDSNSEANDASELAVKDPTLIKIVDGKIDEYVEGTDSIIDYLN